MIRTHCQSHREFSARTDLQSHSVSKTDSSFILTSYMRADMVRNYGQYLFPGLAPHNDREAAIAVTLSPGAYTAIERGKNNTSGIGLVEVYDLNPTAPAKLTNISTRAFVGTGNIVAIAGFIFGNGNGAKVLVPGAWPFATTSWNHKRARGSNARAARRAWPARLGQRQLEKLAGNSD